MVNKPKDTMNASKYHKFTRSAIYSIQGQVTHWIRLYEAQVGGSAGLNRKINYLPLET